MQASLFNIRISSEMHKQAAIIASRKNISLNNFIKFALGWVIKHEKEKRFSGKLTLLEGF